MSAALRKASGAVFASRKGCVRPLFAVLLVGLGQSASAAELQAVTTEAVESGAVTLELGRSVVLAYDDITHVTVADGALIEARALEGTGDLLLIGENPGVTDLRIWTGNTLAAIYEVSVAAPVAELSHDELESIIGPEGDVSINAVRDTLNITGRAGSRAQLERIAALAERFDEVFAYVDAPEVEDAETVFITAQFVEVSNSALRDIGIDWDGSTSGPIFAHASDFVTNDTFRPEYQSIDGSDTFPLDIGRNNQFFGIGTQVESVINLLVEDGFARVIAEPTLSARSGEQADFISGGEVPFPIQTADGGTEVQFREFGISLEVSPVVRPEDRTIRSAVEVEVSNIDGNIQVNGLPGFSRQRARTVMTAPSGESLVIAGLVDQEQVKQISKVPGLGDIPILGELFKSRQLRDDRSELVVVVTPYVGGVDSAINHSLLRRHGALHEQSLHDTRFRLLD